MYKVPWHPIHTSIIERLATRVKNAWQTQESNLETVENDLPLIQAAGRKLMKRKEKHIN
jgi:hypothetical protein